MAGTYERKLTRLRNTRDLRAEILDLAKKLLGNESDGVLWVEEPAISIDTVQNEWTSAIEALSASVQDRMHLHIARRPPASRLHGFTIESGIYPLDRPNHLFEVLRQLIEASLENDGMLTVRTIAEGIGASQPTIRSALAALDQAGLCRRWGHHFELVAEDVTAEAMARTGAMPQTIRFRFSQGTSPRPPAELVERAMLLLGRDSPPEWAPYALSGTPVALASVPKVDLLGTPRLDLVAYAGREAKAMEMLKAFHALDWGLEVEPNPLAHAPMVVTLVRAERRVDQLGVIGQVRCASRADVYLSLLDAGLREQAHEYAVGVRQ